MPNTKDITDARANILLVGDAGSHKTWFIGGMPDPYIFDFDAGTAVLRFQSIEYDTFKDIPLSPAGEPQKPSPKQAAQGFYEFGKGWPAFIKKVNQIGEMIDKGTCPFGTLALDSLTMMSDLALNFALVGQDKRVVHQGTYGAQILLMKSIIGQLSAWPIRLVCTAHVQRDNNDITMNTEKLPLLTGKLAGLISTYFDEVYFCESAVDGASQKFTVKTRATNQMRQAKSRWGVPDDTETSWAAVSKFFNVQPTLKAVK